MLVSKYRSEKSFATILRRILLIIKPDLAIFCFFFLLICTFEFRQVKSWSVVMPLCYSEGKNYFKFLSVDNNEVIKYRLTKLVFLFTSSFSCSN